MEKWANKLTVQNLKWNVSKQVYPVCYSCCLSVTSCCLLVVKTKVTGERNDSNAGEENGFNASYS